MPNRFRLLLHGKKCVRSEEGRHLIPPAEASVKPGSRFPLTWILTVIGLIVSAVFSVACLGLGIVMRHTTLPLPLPPQLGTRSDGNIRLRLQIPFLREFILLCLNLTFVKFAVWSVASAHETTLKWSLAREKDHCSQQRRLEFKSNLRFLQSSYKWYSANGLIANTIMAVCLAVTYASSSMILLGVEDTTHGYDTVMSYLPPLVLGLAILLQVIIATIGLCTTDVPTWSQSPLATARVMVEKGYLTRRPGRCMHSLWDRYNDGSAEPKEKQPTAWHSHPQVRTFVLDIWMSVGAGYYWCFIMWAMAKSSSQATYSSRNPIMDFGWMGEAPTSGMLWGLGVLVGFQGGIITNALTMTGMLVSVSRDETLWKEAGSEKGADENPGVIKMFFTNWQCLAVHIAEPIFHWAFGLAVNVYADVGFRVKPLQVLFISVLGTAGVGLITLVARFHPTTTRQPSTYGHLQTLVDLVDVWGPKIYWGHKPNQPGWEGKLHAGTSASQSDVQRPVPLGEYGDKAVLRC
ncbi:hypothetical protein OE88DRAFT_719863 [Heliocybe sulcata]|uniref:Uncharacterized protein n=1 Tax=Heliocybe sulcata TaxID=5364 RepID=A0A5C3NH13_9AGAM|nr:hypothetical protein OE88DRAFT_719863 [Heliocybe sulcata]